MSATLAINAAAPPATSTVTKFMEVREMLAHNGSACRCNVHVVPMDSSADIAETVNKVAPAVANRITDKVHSAPQPLPDEPPAPAIPIALANSPTYPIATDSNVQNLPSRSRRLRPADVPLFVMFLDPCAFEFASDSSKAALIWVGLALAANRHALHCSV